MKIPPWLVYTLICVVTAVWVANFVISAFNQQYKPPAEINLIFSSLVGGLLLNAASSKKRDDDDKKDRE